MNLFLRGQKTESMPEGSFEKMPIAFKMTKHVCKIFEILCNPDTYKEGDMDIENNKSVEKKKQRVKKEQNSYISQLIISKT